MSNISVVNKIYKKSEIYHNIHCPIKSFVLFIHVLSVANGMRSVNLTNKCQQFKPNDYPKSHILFIFFFGFWWGSFIIREKCHFSIRYITCTADNI